jgi:hypothetical protein
LENFNRRKEIIRKQVVKVTIDIESKKWTFKMNYPTEVQVILIRERISANRIWVGGVSIRDPHICVHNNISPLCDWQTLISDPNVCEQNFEYFMQINHQKYYDEINDGQFIHY